MMYYSYLDEQKLLHILLWLLIWHLIALFALKQGFWLQQHIEYFSFAVLLTIGDYVIHIL